jgi:hypothetical protein
LHFFLLIYADWLFRLPPLGAIFFFNSNASSELYVFLQKWQNELGKNKKWCLNVKLAQEVDVFTINYHSGIYFWPFRLL